MNILQKYTVQTIVCVQRNICFVSNWVHDCFIFPFEEWQARNIEQCCGSLFGKWLIWLCMNSMSENFCLLVPKTAYKNKFDYISFPTENTKVWNHSLPLLHQSCSRPHKIGAQIIMLVLWERKKGRQKVNLFIKDYQHRTTGPTKICIWWLFDNDKPLSSRITSLL